MRHALLLALLLPAAAIAQSNRGGRNGQSMAGGMAGVAAPGAPQQIIAPDVPVLEGLPHAVRVGYTVYVSAMVPLDSAGRLVGSGDLAAQTRQALANLGSVMRAARGVPGDVVRATVYVRNLTPEKLLVVRREVLDGLDRASPPALTVVGVSAFAEPAMEVMIEATGQLRGDFPDRNRMGKP
jgi:enamine deaminase RidA (YjgF/YER057c/UK114 family)